VAQLGDDCWLNDETTSIDLDDDEVNQLRARLVLVWVTIGRQVNSAWPSFRG